MNLNSESKQESEIKSENFQQKQFESGQKQEILIKQDNLIEQQNYDQNSFNLNNKNFNQNQNNNYQQQGFIQEVQRHTQLQPSNNYSQQIRVEGGRQINNGLDQRSIGQTSPQYQTIRQNSPTRNNNYCQNTTLTHTAGHNLSHNHTHSHGHGHSHGHTHATSHNHSHLHTHNPGIQYREVLVTQKCDCYLLINDLQMNLAKYKSKFQQAEFELQNISRQNSNHNLIVEQLNQDILLYKQTIAEYQENKSKYESESLKFKSSDIRIQELEHHLEKSYKKIGVYEQQIEELTEKLKQHDSQISLLKSDLESKHTEIKILQKKEDTIEKLQRQQGKFEDNLKQLNLTIEQQTQQISQKDIEIKRITQKWEKKKKKLQALRATSTKDQVTIRESFELQILNLNKIIESQNNDIQKYKEIAEQKEIELNSRKYNIDILQKSQQSFELSIFKYQEEINNLKLQFEKEKQQYIAANNEGDYSFKIVLSQKEQEFQKLYEINIQLQEQIRILQLEKLSLQNNENIVNRQEQQISPQHIPTRILQAPTTIVRQQFTQQQPVLVQTQQLTPVIQQVQQQVVPVQTYQVIQQQNPVVQERIISISQPQISPLRTRQNQQVLYQSQQNYQQSQQVNNPFLQNDQQDLNRDSGIQSDRIQVQTTMNQQNQFEN